MDDPTLPLVISVSGGRTSALMAILLAKLWRDKKRRLIFIFANTSKERKETIEFLRRLTVVYDLDLVLVEAVVQHGRRKSSQHRVVSFETLRMDGKVYEEMIKKYGVPNQMFPHCTRELKANPIKSYLRSIGVEKYVTAIGYRADEPKRINWEKAKRELQYYPLAETWRITKQQVNEFWAAQPFNLLLREHEGNCDMCWKKSTNKLLTLIVEQPKLIKWWDRMEVKYATIGFERRAATESQITFFRGGMSAKDLIDDAKHPFKRFVEGDTIGAFNELNDVEPDGCTGSCEPF